MFGLEDDLRRATLPRVRAATTTTRRVFAPWLLVWCAATSGTAGATGFASLFGTSLAPLRDAFASSVARSLPVTASSPGFVYRYDFETDVFEREASIAGQLYLEPPDPVGRKRLNLSFNYQWVDFDTFEGSELASLQDTHPPIISSAGDLFTVPRLALSLRTNEFTASATYGLTDDLDVNVTLPLLDSSFHLLLEQCFNPGRGGCRSRLSASPAHGNAVGPGDTFLRVKYRFFHGDRLVMAAGIVSRLPTGNEDDFQGAGGFEIAPMIYAATSRVHVASHIDLRPYVNFGANFDTDDVGQSEGRWGVGVDLGIRDFTTFAVAFFGRHQFERMGSAHAFDVDRCLQTVGSTCTSRTRAPLFGFENERSDFYDVSVGVRLSIWPDFLTAYANVIVPLNDDGLRADAIPLAGIEASF